jgi:arsenate reductase
MNMLLFGLKNCDKCRKAKKNYGLNEIIDVRERPLSEDLLNQAFETFGDSLLNRPPHGVACLRPNAGTPRLR